MIARLTYIQMEERKSSLGQFYTTNADYILAGMPSIPQDARCVIEPFAGKGDLAQWARKHMGGCNIPFEEYDIEPQTATTIARDTLRDPPDYSGAWIITNPPYLARNKSAAKDLYESYNTNDLYKCFIWSLVRQKNNCRGGIMIIPAGFFLSSRNVDAECRSAFMARYQCTMIRYFEEAVFDDTTITVVAIAFEDIGIDEDHEIAEQSIPWLMMPSGTTRLFTMRSQEGWIIGGEIYTLPTRDIVHVRRHVSGLALRENEQQTHMTLCALDGGTANNRIRLEYRQDYIYPAKECSRSYATLRIEGITLDSAEQERLCGAFNGFIEEKRNETWSLFLPQYRESKEYARKRIPFGLAYMIVAHLAENMFL